MRRLAALAFTAGTASLSAFAHAQLAVEYHHAAFDHYFVTAFPGEIAALDGGAFGGAWTRTGETFEIIAAAGETSVAVCRFFSAAFAPRSSHFYTGAADECAAVQANARWIYEGVAFRWQPADANGSCPRSTSPLFRLYNEGVNGAPNHRYVADPRVRLAMLGRGWIAEGAGAGVAGCTPLEVASGASQTVQDRLQSTSTGGSYALSIYLPPTYAADRGAYPIIYAMDRETRFDAQVAALRADRVEAIVVGISFISAQRRFQDFLMPGAPAYYRFLTRELIPHIESRYRADPSRRALSGHSLSGAMAVYAALLQGTDSERHFRWIIAGDPSTPLQAAEFSAMEQAVADSTQTFPLTLLLAGGIGEAGSNVICETLAARNYRGFALEVRKYALAHVPMDLPSFRDAVATILGGEHAVTASVACSYPRL